MNLPGLIGIHRGALPNTNWIGSWIIKPHEDGQGDKVIIGKHHMHNKRLGTELWEYSNF